MKTSKRQVVDLDANGQTRILYFTIGDYQSRKLNSWWHTLDGYDRSKVIPDSPAYVIIELKDNRTSTAKFRFKIEHSPDMMTISRINNKKQVITYREFQYSQLLKNEKKEDNNGRQTIKKTTKGTKKGSPHQRGLPKGTKKGN